LGDPKIVSVWGELFPRNLEITNNRLDKDPNGVYQVVFENGVEATSIHAGTWEFEVIGSTGSLRMLNNGQGILLRKAKNERERVFHETPALATPQHSPTQFCLEDLVAAHEEDRPTLGNIQVTHHLTEACLAVAESHRQRARVKLPLENRSLYVFHV
jgi:predicted dehydrogenase